MSIYRTDEWKGFVLAMRADPYDRTTPGIAADWLNDKAKYVHERFIRGCLRIAALRDILDECLKMDLHYTDPTRSVPEREMMQLIHDLRPSIEKHAHEWTGGMVRRFHNPTVYDWPCGFLRSWRLYPLKVDSDRETDLNVLKQFAALLARQPIQCVRVDLPAMTFAPPSHILDYLAKRFPGVEFLHGNLKVAASALLREASA